MQHTPKYGDFAEVGILLPGELKYTRRPQLNGYAKLMKTQETAAFL